MTYDLIQVYTEDNLKLTGLATKGSKDKTAYIFIHGFEDQLATAITSFANKRN